MELPESKALYKLRGQTVELSFGDAKEHRNFRRFNGHGKLIAAAQTAIIVLLNNITHLAKAITTQILNQRKNQ